MSRVQLAIIGGGLVGASLALALQAGERFQRDEQVLTLFTYDLLDYKQVPDWLNARFWANPENFGKYWW